MSALRPATAGDLPALGEVFVAAWRAGYRGVVPDEIIDAQSAPAVTAGWDDPDEAGGLDTVVAADTTGRPLGFARYGPDAEHPGCGYLAALYVHPDAAGTGVGRQLVCHVLDAMPGIEVRLWVFEANARARRLYERAGFRPDGARLTDPRWRTPQVRYRYRASNQARPLPPLPERGVCR